ncbi:tRNA pseudouridine(38-40) synthase TruA [Schleiferia thermophila]|jgi:tRNA pseudouridine38-40 synthase|uniref:tRNA pseudouridine synthase A n=1 Tax=Schleiferia thermophila TaxID=884107 RepID=A0A369A3L8_9FLAO|nr:tRNA pseudouridine(38-40) synthase TruA [Schleiferia thermophila]KFD38744.1 hypothetical protein AT05_08870 [Schleiferia thermophila str. Yellowstone]RCX02044.1 tRNA pseudouridine38-40 synthase [Schleiferia thermophila]GCD80567.1 tRNA pseudouridine synthase A [Schleiferia thermophila]
MYLCKGKVLKSLRYFIEIAYNGMAFHGWQIQPNAVTVQQRLNEALSLVLRQKVYAVGAGRTDTGVHALQMFAHFDLAERIPDSNKIVRSLNGVLYPDVAVKQIFEVPGDAHARFSALSRTYKYFVHYSPNPFLHHRSLLWLWTPLDLQVLNTLCELLLGEKDFSCFEKVGGSNSHSLCNVSYANWKPTKHGAVFTITANRFLRNMVRAIVGTMLDVSTGKLKSRDFACILQSGDRKIAGSSAAPYALYLTEVCYPDTIFLHEKTRQK